MDVFDADGTQLADIPISEKQMHVLEAGELVTVIFHTPQLYRHVLGEHSGSFTLRKIDGKVITSHPDKVKEMAELQAAAARAREAR